MSQSLVGRDPVISNPPLPLLSQKGWLTPEVQRLQWGVRQTRAYSCPCCREGEGAHAGADSAHLGSLGTGQATHRAGSAPHPHRCRKSGLCRAVMATTNPAAACSQASLTPAMCEPRVTGILVTMATTGHLGSGTVLSIPIAAQSPEAVAPFSFSEKDSGCRGRGGQWGRWGGGRRSASRPP